MSQLAIEMPISTEGEERGLTLREIFDESAPFVWRTLHYLGIPEADLQDACQDVFVVVHQKLPEFEGRSSIRTWLYGICMRVAAGHRRKAHVRREIVTSEPPDQSVEANPGDALDDERARAVLYEVLAGVDEPKRQVFVLFEIEQRPMTEIAEVLGCPLRTAYARLEAAREEIMRAWHRALHGRRAK